MKTIIKIINKQLQKISTIYFSQHSIKRQTSLLIYLGVQFIFFVLSFSIILDDKTFSNLIFNQYSFFIGVFVHSPFIIFSSLLIYWKWNKINTNTLDAIIFLSICFNYGSLFYLSSAFIANAREFLIHPAALLTSFHAYYFPAYNRKWIGWNKMRIFGSTGLWISFILFALFYIVISQKTDVHLILLVIIIGTFFIALIIPVYMQVKWTQTDILARDLDEEAKRANLSFTAIQSYIPTILEISDIETEEHLAVKMEELTEVIRDYLDVEYAVIGLIKDDSFVEDFMPKLAYELDENEKFILAKYLKQKIENSSVGVIVKNSPNGFCWNHEPDGDFTDNNVFNSKFGYSIPIESSKEHIKSIFRSKAIKSILIEPLFNRNKIPIGYICLINKLESLNPIVLKTQGFSPEEHKNISFIAKQIAIAIQNFRYHHNAFQDEIAINSQIQKTNAGSVFKGILNHLVKITKAEYALLWIPTENTLQDDSKKVVIQTSCFSDTFSDENKKKVNELMLQCHSFDSSYIGKLIDGSNWKEPQYINLIDQVCIFSEFNEINSSCIFLPIPKNPKIKMSPYNVWGFISIRPKKKFEWNDKIKDRLSKISIRTQPILERFIYEGGYKQISVFRSQMDQLDFNNEINFYNRLVSIVNETLGTENCSIFLVDQSKKHLYLKATTASMAWCKNKRMDHAQVKKLIKKKTELYKLSGDSLTASMFKIDKPVIINDPKAHRINGAFIEGEIEAHRNLMGITLKIDGRKIGVLKCVNKRHDEINIMNLFSLADKEFMSLIIGIVERFVAYFENFKQHIDVISHEISTPIDTLFGYNNTLRNTLKESAALQQEKIYLPRSNQGSIEHYINTVEEQLETIKYTIQSVEYAHLVNSEGYISIDKKKEAISGIINEVVKLYSPTLQLYDINVINNAGEVLNTLLFDKNAMKLVFINLIKNAIRYSRPIEGKRKTEPITINYRKGDRFHEIDIVNYGMPINDDEKEIIFNYGVRGQNSYIAPSGTGIGLFVCRKIIEAHNGSLEVKSLNPTTFSIRLI